jgi:hypothetical protein
MIAEKTITKSPEDPDSVPNIGNAPNFEAPPASAAKLANAVKPDAAIPQSTPWRR